MALLSFMPVRTSDILTVLVAEIMNVMLMLMTPSPITTRPVS